MILWTEQQRLIEAEMANFPKTFRLRAYPDAVFCILLRDSYVNDDGEIALYVGIQQRDNPNTFLAFAKGSPAELRKEII